MNPTVSVVGGQSAPSNSLQRSCEAKLVEQKNHKISFASLEGATIDDINFVKLIGYGSHGEVYNATIKNQLFAVKVIRRKRLPGVIIADAITPEIAKQIRLQHPNIVRVHSVKYKNGYYLVVMELMKESVRSLLKRTVLPLRTLIRIAKDVALALHYLHTSRCPYPIVHFDVRSSNVLLPFDSSQPCKLTDFGLAAYFTLNDPNLLENQTDSQKFPLLWSAPEVLQRKFSPASDIYSYGVLLWELVTRMEPRQFIPNSLKEQNKTLEHWLLENDFTLPLPPQIAIPAELVELPPEFFELIKLCWQKDPQKRPSAEQILTYLDFITYRLSQCNPKYTPLYGVHMAEAVQRGLKENLKIFFQTHLPFERFQKSAKKINRIVVHGVEFFSEYGPGASGMMTLAHLAARQGNIDLLEYFSDLQPLPPGLGFVAACHQRLNVLDYLLYSGYTLGNEVLLGALLGGHVNIIGWAVCEIGLQPQQYFAKIQNLFATILASHPHLSPQLWEKVQSYELIPPSLNCFLWGIAVGNGNAPLVKELLRRSVFTNDDIKRLTQPSNVLPILMQAVLSNSPKVVKLLLKSLDRSILEQQKFGIDALHLCCYTGNLNVLKLLLDYGLGPNSQYGRGTPLYFAKETKQYEITKELEKRGAKEEGPLYNCPKEIRSVDASFPSPA
jgi:serine/threonine protein kinase